MEVLLNNDIMKGSLLPDRNHAMGFFWEIGLPMRMILISVLLLCSLTVMIASIKWIFCPLICDLLVKKSNQQKTWKQVKEMGESVCSFALLPCPPLCHTTPPLRQSPFLRSRRQVVFLRLLHATQVVYSRLPRTTQVVYQSLLNATQVVYQSLLESTWDYSTIHTSLSAPLVKLPLFNCASGLPTVFQMTC